VDLRRLVVPTLLVLLMSGCGTETTSHPTTDRASLPEPTHPASTDSGQPGRHRSLTLLPPGCSPGQLRLGPATPDGGGGEDFQVWSVHLVHGPPCTVWGTPTLRFLDAHGAVLPFAVTDRWRHAHRGPVLVDARHSPNFPVEKFRCDTVRNPPVVASVVATLPLGAGTLTGTVPRAAARLQFCPRQDGDQRIHVGSIGTWQTTGAPLPHQVAVSMHSRFAPLGLPTWGRADVDGDGRPNLVVVRPSGQVDVTLGRHVVHARVAGRPTDRLQGFTDLTGDGRPEILVASTALGCGAGYRWCASRAAVLTVRDGRLRVLHFPEPALSWDDGQGDLYAGLVCGAHGPAELQLLMTGGQGYRLTRTRYQVSGLRAHAVDSTTVHGTAADSRLAGLITTRCPGLDRWGWAQERGPLG
jgi:hypothetical protein